MVIKVNKIIPQTIPAYNPSGEFLGELNYFEFNDLRIQIKNEKVSGYYMIYNEQKIPIRSDGVVTYWPAGFFSLWDEQMDILLDL